LRVPVARIVSAAAGDGRDDSGRRIHPADAAVEGIGDEQVARRIEGQPRRVVQIGVEGRHAISAESSVSSVPRHDMKIPGGVETENPMPGGEMQPSQRVHRGIAGPLQVGLARGNAVGPTSCHGVDDGFAR